jgi:hypothetical protein
MEPPALTPQQKYRRSDKCKAARVRYYDDKGKETAHNYYIKNRDAILARSKERYATKKQALAQNNLSNDLNTA